MELRYYIAALRRRLWIVVAVTLVALVASAAGMVLVPQALSYQATVRLAVRPAAEPRSPFYYTYDEYYAYLASEYLNDDVIELVQGQLFMDEIRRRAPDTPAGSIKGKKAHRVLTLTVTAGSAEGALAIARTATDVLTEAQGVGQRYFEQLTAQKPTVTVIDPPAITSAPGTRSVADLLLRGALGLIVGLGLAFLIDYLDDTLRDAADAEQELGVPVLGEIPAPR